MTDEKPPPPDFEEFKRVYREVTTRELSEHCQRLGLEVVEEVALKTRYVAETGRFKNQNTPAHIVRQNMIAKFSQEIFGFIGCMRAGSLVGAFHHLRAVIELRAAVQYIWGSIDEPKAPKDTLERSENYVDWPEVNGYAAYRRARLALDSAPDDPTAASRFERESAAYIRFENTEEAKRENWARRYGRGNKLKRRAHIESGRPIEWHSPRSLMDLIDQLDGAHPTPRTTVSARALYEICCNATHVSPSAGKLSTSRGLYLLGFDDKHASMAIVEMLDYTILFASEIAPQCDGVFDGIFENERREAAKLRAADKDRPFPRRSA